MATIASLVIDIATNTAKLTTGVDQVNNKLDGFASKALSVGKTLGIAFGVSEVLSFGKQLVDTSGQMVDLADQLGLTTGEVRAFSKAAELGGGSTEGFATSMDYLSRKLGEGSAKTAETLTSLGLSLDAVRKMRPAEYFAEVSDRIANMSDKSEQAAARQELLGRGAASMTAALGDMKGALKDADGSIDDYDRALDESGDSIQAVTQYLKEQATLAAGHWAKTLQTAIRDTRHQWQILFDLIGRTKEADAMPTLPGVPERFGKVKGVVYDSAAAMRDAESALKDLDRGHQKAADAAEQHANKIRGLRDQLTGLDAVADAKEILQAARNLDVTKLSAENTRRALDTLNDAIEALKANGRTVPADMQRLRDSLADIAAEAEIAKIALEPIAELKVNPASERVLRSLTSEIDAAADAARKAADERQKHADAEGKFWKNSQDYAEKQAKFQAEAAKSTADSWDKSLKNISNGFAQMAQISGGSMGKVSSGIGTALSAVMTAKEGFSALTTTIDAVKGVSGAASAAGAIGGAASAGGAIAAGSGMLGMVSTIGLCATGVGAIVPAAMLAFKALNKVFGNAGRDMVKDYAKEVHGGFDGLQKKLQGFGAEGEAMWVKLTQGVGRNDKKAAEAAIKEVEAFLAAQDEKFNESLQRQLEGIREFGGAVPKELQPYLDTLLESGRITEANIALMEELSGGGEISWRKMEEAAKKYGIETGTLGENFQRQRLHEGWKELIDDAKLLVDGGADVNGMLVGMQDEISKLVQDSQKFGFAIPENMRKFIEPLIASRQLLDENGNAIEDINSLTFGAEIKDSMSELIDEIRELVKTLGGVPPAIAAIPKNVDIDVNYRQRKYGDAPEGAPDPQHSYANGTDGFVNFGAGTLAMLHGEEMVVPKHKAGLFGGINVVVNAQTNATPEQIASAVTTHLNRYAFRY